jgi:membrane glycosyltransferase
VYAAIVGKQGRAPKANVALNVAVLSPIYNESPSHVFGNVAAMIEQLRNTPSHHRYSFFLLSDTQDPAIAALEGEAMLHLRAQMRLDIPVYYRRRRANTDRKTGNLAQWIQNWGGDFDAMLVFDADSLMSAEGIHALTDTLAADSTLGLVQSSPRLIGSDTLFGRMQQFSSAAFGHFPALGEAFWSDREANYHGHNAIMRTEAFATCAGLAYLQDRKGRKTLIFWHDFVEASLLRRAGWGVRMVPTLDPTYEETPTTLIDYVLRDRRWCQGNMQHLRIMWSRGFHSVSRFLLGQNALTYLMSPLWFSLVIIGAVLGTSDGGGVLAFITGTAAADAISFAVLESSGLWLLALVYALLIAPKAVETLRVVSQANLVQSFKGRLVFVAGAFLELLGSMAIAPVLMVQQTRAIIGIVIGKHESWGPQKRYAAQYDLATVLRFHWMETLIGAVLTVGMISGVASLWLLPIAISLIGAVGLSVLSGWKMSGKIVGLFTTPFESKEPAIVSLARDHQNRIETAPYHHPQPRMAAE